MRAPATRHGVVQEIAVPDVSGNHQDAYPPSLIAAAVLPIGRTLAWTGVGDGIARLREVATGKQRRRLEGHRGSVHSLAFAQWAGTISLSRFRANTRIP